MIEKFVNRLHNFLKIPSVIGYETPFIDHLISESYRLGLKHEVLTERTGRKVLLAISSDDFTDRPILSAHIDRHGLYKLTNDELIFRGRGEDARNEQVEDIEYASSFIKRTEFDKDTFTPERMQKVCNYFVGETVNLYHPTFYEIIKQSKIEDLGYCVIRENLTFKIPDFYSISMPEHKILPISFQPEESIFDGDFIRGQIDNALSVALIMELFERNHKFTALFAVDEEIGLSWEYILRWFKKSNAFENELVVLDTSPYFDEVLLKTLQSNGALVLRNKDNNGVFDQNLTNKFKDFAIKNRIDFDFKDLTLEKSGASNIGSTELGKLITKSDKYIKGTTLQVPTSEYHTNRESVAIESVENMMLLLEKYLEN